MISGARYADRDLRWPPCACACACAYSTVPAGLKEEVEKGVAIAIDARRDVGGVGVSDIDVFRGRGGAASAGASCARDVRREEGGVTVLALGMGEPLVGEMFRDRLLVRARGL